MDTMYRVCNALGGAYKGPWGCARLRLVPAQPQQRGQVDGIVGPAQLKRSASAAAQDYPLPAHRPH